MRVLLDAILRRLITVGRLTSRAGRTVPLDLPVPSEPHAAEAPAAIGQHGPPPRAESGAGRWAKPTWTAPCAGWTAAIYDVLDLLLTNLAVAASRPPGAAACSELLAGSAGASSSINPGWRAQRNVAHHYDLNGRLYSLFLDRDRQYSCAYFPRGDETLEEAQAAKKRHIAAKLLPRPAGPAVLDIGCGWGGMALTLARDYGAHVTGITLSQEQLTEARARAAAEGLADRVRSNCWITARCTGVRPHRLGRHVRACRHRPLPALLRHGGALPGAGRRGADARHRPQRRARRHQSVDRQIHLPGRLLPGACRRCCRRSRSSGLMATDIEILRLHYAETLRHWRRRFAANRDAIAALYDERFCRMFEFYLAGSELTFRREGTWCGSSSLPTSTGVPLTRDYIAAAEGSSRTPAVAASNPLRRCVP